MRPPIRRLALLLVPLVAFACAESVTGHDGDPRLRRDAVSLAASGRQLLSCAAPPVVAVGGSIMDDSGGSLTVGRRRLRVPPGALHADQRVVMSTPASAHVMVDLKVEGFEHYTFDRPVTVTIDYSRCTDAELAAAGALRVVYIDPATLDILEDMGGAVDSAAHTITFETGHFSTYAVAY